MSLNSYYGPGRREVREQRSGNGYYSTTNTGRGYGASSFDFDKMIASLRDLFEHDRQVASQTEAARCGICYLHFVRTELNYREDGFYVCSTCNEALSRQILPMLRRQQK